MAAQPFDPKTLADSLNTLGASRDLIEKIKSMEEDIGKNLSEQEKSQLKINKLTGIQSSITTIIDEKKKAGLVYDDLSFQLENKRLQTQQKILSSQEDALKDAIDSGALTQEQLKRANEMKDSLFLQNVALGGNVKMIQTQIKDGAKIEEVYKHINGQLSEEKKNISDANTNLANTNNFLKDTLKLVTMIGGTKFIDDLKFPKDASTLFGNVYDLFKQIDKAATSIRKTFGLFRSDAAIIESNIREIVVELAEFGIKADDVKKSISSIGKTFNYINTLDKTIVKDISMMAKQMDISEEKSAKFLKTIGGIKGESGIANKSMLSFAGSVATAYGIGLDEVMSDVAEASDDVRMYAGKTADELIIGAAQARQMGTTLDNMAKSSKSLLNFETSIQAELKASALIGKNINFNEARRLAFQGKTVEANKLILDQAKKIKFNQLNPIAQEAFAAAAGKSVKELQDMLESENRMKSALTSNNKEVRDAAKAQLEKQNLLKTNGKLAQDEYEKNLLNKSNQERIVILQDRLNAAMMKIMLPVLEAITDAMEKLVNLTSGLDLQNLIKDLSNVKTLGTALKDNFFRKIKVVKDFISFPFKSFKALLETVNKLIDVFSTKTITILTDLLNKIKSINNFILDIPNKISKSFGSLQKLGSLIKTYLQGSLAEAIQPFEFLIKKFKGIGDIFKPIKDLIEPVIKGFKSLVSTASQFPKLMKILKFAGFGLKWASGIGEIIAALEFLYKSYKNVMEVINNPNLSFSEKLIGAFKGIAKAAYSAFLETFVDIGAWIGENVFGSFYDVMIDAGESVYNFFGKVMDGTKKVVTALWTGVKDIFSFLIPDVIIEGFNKAYEGIKEWLGFSPSQIGLSIVNGIKSVMDMLFDVLTYPFKKSFQLVKSAVSDVAAIFKDVFSSAFTFIVDALEKVWEKMKGIGSFISETIGKTFNFVGRIIGVSEETTTKPAGETKTAGKSNDLLISTIVDSNRAVLEKLDKLTSMMASGQIAVYIDGQRANQLLATSNSKFGSFGQATTN